jgi:site-specific DNA-methyltransferase (cytosine-N4-specific)
MNSAGQSGVRNGEELSAREKATKKEGVRPAYRTQSGVMLLGTVEEALSSRHLKRIEGTVNLIFTSPPFPLVKKKRYGNKTGDEYLTWLTDLAPKLSRLLAPDGSIVIELGNAWVLF